MPKRTTLRLGRSGGRGPGAGTSEPRINNSGTSRKKKRPGESRGAKDGVEDRGVEPLTY